MGQGRGWIVRTARLNGSLSKSLYFNIYNDVQRERRVVSLLGMRGMRMRSGSRRNDGFGDIPHGNRSSAEEILAMTEAVKGAHEWELLRSPLTSVGRL